MTLRSARAYSIAKYTYINPRPGLVIHYILAAGDRYSKMKDELKRVYLIQWKAGLMRDLL